MKKRSKNQLVEKIKTLYSIYEASIFDLMNYIEEKYPIEYIKCIPIFSAYIDLKKEILIQINYLFNQKRLNLKNLLNLRNKVFLNDSFLYDYFENFENNNLYNSLNNALFYLNMVFFNQIEILNEERFRRKNDR